jgi:excisionase family DNA binding protein
MTKKLTGTVEESAEVLGISRNKAYEAVHEGQIPSIRVGRKIRVLWGPLMEMVGAADEEGHHHHHRSQVRPLRRARP